MSVSMDLHHHVTVTLSLMALMASMTAVGACAPKQGVSGKPASPTADVSSGNTGGDVVRMPLSEADNASMEKAVKLMDAGQPGQAIAILKEVLRQNPHHELVLHELGYAHRLDKHPERCASVLAPYERSLRVKTLAEYASCLDEAGHSKASIQVLEAGLKRHPHAGLLFSELGTTYVTQQNIEKALDSYFQGMRAEPTWPSNYYNLTRIFSVSGHSGMSLVWGEMFRLLEPNSRRSEGIGRLMVGVYQKGISVKRGVDGKVTIHVQLAAGPVRNLAQSDGPRLFSVVDFEHAHEAVLTTSMGPLFLGGGELSLARLHQARSARFSAEGKEPAPAIHIELFDWLRALAKAGHLEAYDYWLYGPGFPKEAHQWAGSHRGQLLNLQDYLDSHPFRPSDVVMPDQPVRFLPTESN